MKHQLSCYKDVDVDVMLDSPHGRSQFVGKACGISVAAYDTKSTMEHSLFSLHENENLRIIFHRY